MIIFLSIITLTLTVLTIDDYLFWIVCNAHDEIFGSIPVSRRFKTHVIVMTIVVILMWIFIFCFL